MIKITLERLQTFVERYGDIKIVDRTGKTSMIRPDQPDVFDLIDKADRFWFNDVWYAREDFVKLLEKSEPLDKSDAKKANQNG